MKHSTNISIFTALPSHCTVEDVEAASMEAIRRSFNSNIPYSDEAYAAMASKLAMSEVF